MALRSLLLSFPFLSSAFHFHTDPPVANGLSWTYYESTCKNVESIVRKELRKAIKKDVGLAAALLRIHFHDCFVQGCDASVLLDGSASGPGEKDAPPNLTLRKPALALIDRVRGVVQKKCGRVVSCADITALAARDSVHLTGGPDYPVPLGRRDGVTFATISATLASLPPPSANASSLISALSLLDLDPTDLVALSGGHTIGVGHCPSFTSRLYPTQDPAMDKYLAGKLRLTCPAADTDNITAIDIRTPTVFDNKYYIDLMNRQGLFTSDQDLYTDSRTREIVTAFAVNEGLFFERFAYAMVKMGQLGVLTSGQGEVRANCSARNPVAGGEEDVWLMVERVGDGGASTVSAM